jgi:hypothetical protein
MVLYTVYLLYSELAVFLFGGWIGFESIIEINNLNSGIPVTYVYLNFNDIAGGFITLFAIMVNNNWQIIVYMYTLQTQ